MFTKTVNYEDFLGNERSETVYFHLSQNEIVEFAMELPDEVSEAVGDPANMDEEAAALKIAQAIGNKGIVDFLKKLIVKSYGVPSEDGRKFEKSEELSKEFAQTIVYDEILMELMTDDEAANKFVNQVIPAKLVKKMEEKTGHKMPGLPMN